LYPKYFSSYNLSHAIFFRVIQGNNGILNTVIFFTVNSDGIENEAII
jgi:hypothetical protein